MKKRIIILAGLPFSGKSTLGKKLSELYSIPFLDIDDARHEVVPGNAWHGPEKEKELMMAAYIHNHEKATDILTSGGSVILAATYSRESYHDMVRDLARQQAALLQPFLLQIPDALVPTRMQERFGQISSSNIVTMESYDEVRNRYQPFESEELIHIDTSQSVEETLNAITQYLPRTDN